MGHAVAGANHLGDVMNGSAEEKAGMQRRQVEKLGDHRVKDHGHGGQRRNANDREQRRALLLLMAGQRCRQGKGRRSATNGSSPTREQAEQGTEAHGAGCDDGR
ncbi:hypothetical protein D9M71_591870 [compost metagenome]